MPVYVTSKLLAHLGLVAADRVTYREAGRGRSYRVWASCHPQERSYVTSTPTVRTLVKDGMARHVHGYRSMSSGIVELTPAGYHEVVDRMGPFWAALAGWAGYGGAVDT